MPRVLLLDAGFYGILLPEDEAVRYGLECKIDVDERTGVVTEKRSACTACMACMACTHYFGYVMGLVCRLSTAKRRVLGLVYDRRIDALLHKRCDRGTLARRASSFYGLDALARDAC